MASVLFTTVGQAVGGPLGAAVGAAVGGGVDSALFARGGVRPDLQVQRSAYGDALPRLFGLTRTAGVVIWAQPMRDGAGKGDGRRGYRTSLAVALSSGPIREVRRIWADGREIRNAEGVFESAITMRVYPGVGQAAADPLIAAAEGVGQTPGYRGLAYVVFEDLPLAAFGNRIPNLSFEVAADFDSPAGWLQSLALDRVAVVPGPAPIGAGYAAAASRMTADMEPLARAGGLETVYPEGALALAADGPTLTIPLSALASGRDGAPARNARLGSRPGSLALGYLDPARDFQAGYQLVSRGRIGPALVRQAPLTATAAEARTLAERWLMTEEASAEQLTLDLGWAWLDVGVGTVIALEGRAERWRVTRCDVRGLMLRLTAVLVAGPADAVPGDSGRALLAPARPSTATELTLFETPMPLKPGQPALWVLASGGDGWRGAEVRLLDAGLEASLGRVGTALPWGQLAAALGSGPETLWDEAADLRLSPAPGLPALESRSPLDVLAGANLLLVGDELLQFREVAPLGDGTLRILGLLRGRFGTRAVAHPAGTRVRLVRADALVAAPIAADSTGRRIDLLALGAGDPIGGTLASHMIDGRGLGPMAPVHLQVSRQAGGALLSRWIPRGREALDWAGIEPPATGFLWHFEADDGRRWTVAVPQTSLALGVAEQNAGWGGLLPAGAVRVEAVGEGPAALRTSGAARLPASA